MTDSVPKCVFDWKWIPPRFRGKTLQNFETKSDPDPRRVAMEAFRNKKGLFISGPTGTGKTHLGVAASATYFNELPMRTDDNSPLLSPETFMFLPSVEFFLKLKASFDKTDGESEILSEINNKTLVMLDDVGAEKVTNWSRQMFYTLIDRRYRSMGQTIITSNLSLEQLAEEIDDRIASRIVEMCVIINLDGKDHRVGK